MGEERERYMQEESKKWAKGQLDCIHNKSETNKKYDGTWNYCFKKPINHNPTKQKANKRKASFNQQNK